MRFLSVCLASLVLMAAASAVEPVPQVAVGIANIDPADGATLHNSADSVYVHVHYVSDAPIKVWIRPYYQGKEVPALSNGSFVHSAGEGEAFGWFACPKVCSVDSIHVQLATADSGYPFLDQAASVNYTWDGAAVEPHASATWVKPMLAHEKELQDKAYKEYMSRPYTGSDWLILALFYVAVLGALTACFAWPIYGLIRWQGKWRWFAGAPLVVAGLKTLKIASDVSADPTSHNLLPFEYLILAAVVAPYMVVIWLLRRKIIRMNA